MRNHGPLKRNLELEEVPRRVMLDEVGYQAQRCAGRSPVQLLDEQAVSRYTAVASGVAAVAALLAVW